LQRQLRRLVTPRIADLCQIDDSGVSPSSSRRRALDYRAFALMDDPPTRIQHLAQRLIREHELELDDAAGLSEFYRSLCYTLAEVYENAAGGR